MPVSRPLSEAIVVISDLVQHQAGFPLEPTASDSHPSVRGGYLERLPLAAVCRGVVGSAEIWHHHLGNRLETSVEDPFLTRRAFPVSGEAPFHSVSMIDFIAEHGAPRILCVWGLGVSEAVLEACADSLVIYNSIDVSALRVPVEVSRHFDLVLTGAQWQSDDVLARHPDMPTAIMPIGPEFASPVTFFPIDVPKDYDVIYVAAAQPYKRHDILFDALARCNPPLRALCVMGYGEDADRLRREAAERGLAVDFVGPPGISHAQVNRLMNRARVGVVCGVDDGAPAILTEYMLAGLPVVANAGLRCGLQYITPQAGLAIPADRFEEGIFEALSRDDFTPRQTVLDRWAWPHSMNRLEALIEPLQRQRNNQPVRRLREGALA